MQQPLASTPSAVFFNGVKRMSNHPTEIGGLSNTGLMGEDVFSFGPFRLYASRRLVERAGVPLRLGSRALEILIVLIQNAGTVINKRDLTATVWPDVTVGEGCLRVHVAALRKALGDGVSGARYVTNVSARGYCFVGSVSRSKVLRVSDGGATDRPYPLSSQPKRVAGRDETIRRIAVELASKRLATLVGPGSGGRTTVAVAAAQQLLVDLIGDLVVFDLRMPTDSGIFRASPLSSDS
jgi:DNA-binding winged helix-turn-helix (wHTH) protein